MKQASILFVDDEPDILLALKRTLRKESFDVKTANGAEEALELIETNHIDIIVSDLSMPHMDGVEFFTRVSTEHPDIIRIMLTAHSDAEAVLKSINEGRVWGYLQKPWDNRELIILLNQALKARNDALEKSMLKQMLLRYRKVRRSDFKGFIGDSVVMQFVYSAIEKAAPSQASVFITGPSGCGKELAAQAIHQLSKRCNNAFIAVNCAAIPNELMESEIFGHVKGAFSGASADRKGLATLADKGTLFLDELGEMDIILQAKLLRFIQTGEFSKVGSSKVEKVDVRFIAATNREPIEAIKEKLLREDLFYRLNVIGIDLPALKYRESDVLQLASSFLKEFCAEEGKRFIGFSKDAHRLLLKYDWPGNIRQLRNTIHSCVILSEGSIIDEKILSQQLKLDKLTAEPKPNKKVKVASGVIDEKRAHSHVNEEARDKTKDQILPLSLVERRAIEQAINLCDENIVQAASALGVSPSTLYRKIQSWQD